MGMSVRLRTEWLLPWNGYPEKGIGRIMVAPKSVTVIFQLKIIGVTGSNPSSVFFRKTSDFKNFFDLSKQFLLSFTS